MHYFEQFLAFFVEIWIFQKGNNTRPQSILFAWVQADGIIAYLTLSVIAAPSPFPG
jgi:hypothetical protein